MQRKRQIARFRRIVLIERGGDGVQKLRADSALFVAQFDLACGVLHGLPDRRVRTSNGKGRGETSAAGRRSTIPLRPADRQARLGRH